MNDLDPVTSDAAEPARLAEQHLPLVAHLVREVAGRVPASVERDDLRSAALLALVTAARAFDPSVGTPFGAYAAVRIRGALLDELRSVDWASRSVRRRAHEVEATRQRLASALGQFPDDAAVAQALGLSVTAVVRSDADVARATVVSLHGPTGDGQEAVPARAPGPEQVVERTEHLEFVADAVTELPERLRAVVRGYFLEERPMAEIAAELGVTESRVSQMRAEALVLLRTALTSAFEPALTDDGGPTGVAARRKAAYASAVAARHLARRPMGRPA